MLSDPALLGGLGSQQANRVVKFDDIEMTSTYVACKHLLTQTCGFLSRFLEQQELALIVCQQLISSHNDNAIFIRSIRPLEMESHFENRSFLVQLGTPSRIAVQDRFISVNRSTGNTAASCVTTLRCNMRRLELPDCQWVSETISPRPPCPENCLQCVRPPGGTETSHGCPTVTPAHRIVHVLPSGE